MEEVVVDAAASNFQEIVLDGSRQVPVIVDFWAPWCGPCRALGPILEKLAREYGGRFRLAKVNSDENQALAAEYGVRGIPDVKAFVDGRVVAEFSGARPEGAVRKFIDDLMPSPSELSRAAAAAAAGRGDTTAALALLDEAVALDPRNDRARVDAAELLLEVGRIEEARGRMNDLSPLADGDVRVERIRARLRFAGQQDVDPSALLATIAADPGNLAARQSYANLCVHEKRYEDALEQLLEIVRRDRKFDDDAGRKGMIAVFNLLGPASDLTGRYRRLLASALN